MNQSILASLSHTHYWYGVSILKVPAESIEPKLSCVRFFLLPPKFPSFFTSRLYRSWGFLHFFVPPRPSLDPSPRLPSPGSGPPHDGTVLLRHRVLRLAAVVAGYKLASSPLSRLPNHLFYHFLGSRALSLPSTRFSILVLVPAPAPVLAPSPPSSSPPFPSLPRPLFPSSLSPSRPSCPVFPSAPHRGVRHRVFRPKLRVTCRHHLLSTEIMPRAEWQ